jgi:two-component system response regulator NreC
MPCEYSLRTTTKLCVKVFAPLLSSRLDIEICGEAVNGQEAIEKAKELRPDLVILDITMPILGGVEAAKEIRRISPEIPILFLSMHQSNQLVAEAKRLGVQGS